MGEHSTGSAGPVIKQVRAGLDGVLHWKKDEVRHKLYGIARSPVLARFFIILSVEPAQQFLEDRAHRMVVEGRLPDGTVVVEYWPWTEIYVGIQKLVNQGP